MNPRGRLRKALGDELLADLLQNGTQEKLEWLASVVNDLDSAYTPHEVKQWFDITQMPLDGMTPRQCLTKNMWEPESENAIRVQILASVLPVAIDRTEACPRRRQGRHRILFVVALQNFHPHMRRLSRRS